MKYSSRHRPVVIQLNADTDSEDDSDMKHTRTVIPAKRPRREEGGLVKEKDGLHIEGDGLPREGGSLPREGGGLPREGGRLPRGGDVLPRVGSSQPREGEGLLSSLDVLLKQARKATEVFLNVVFLRYFCQHVMQNGLDILIIFI